jgi:two-component system cell cycle sensor histidine kinase/response regulator CckA
MDDEEMIREIALEMLSYLGFQVVLANDGAEAIDVYQKNLAAGGKPFDIVIMDLTIPGGMGGSKAIKKILKLNPQAKVIVSSGYSNDPVMANYMDHGFSGVITKPFKINELSEAIHKILVD